MEKDIEPEKADFTYSPQDDLNMDSILELYIDECEHTLDVNEKIDESLYFSTDVDEPFRYLGFYLEQVLIFTNIKDHIEQYKLSERETAKQDSSDLFSAMIEITESITHPHRTAVYKIKLPIIIDIKKPETWQSNYTIEFRRTKKCLQHYKRYRKRLPENKPDLTERVNVLSQQDLLNLLKERHFLEMYKDIDKRCVDISVDINDEMIKTANEMDSGLLFLELFRLINRIKTDASQEQRIYLLVNILQERGGMHKISKYLAKEITLTLALGRFSDTIYERASQIENAMKERMGLYPIHSLLDAAGLITCFGGLDESVPAILETFDTYLRLDRMKTIIALTWATPPLIRAIHDIKLVHKIEIKIKEGLKMVDSEGTFEQRVDYITALANVHLANPGRVKMLRDLAYNHPLRMQSELCRRYLY